MEIEAQHELQYEDLDQSYEHNLSTDHSDESIDVKNQSEEVISYAKIIKHIQDLVDFLKELGYSEAHSLKILKKCKWNKNRALDKIADELDPAPIEDLSLSDKQEFECINCSIRDQIENSYSLGCKHWFCEPCFFEFLESAIQEKRFLKPCPIDGCCEVITPGHYQKHLQNASKKYEMLMFEDYASTQENITLLKCPRNGCLMIHKLPEPKDNGNGNLEPSTIKCECGYSFCSKCPNVPHKRLTCKNYSNFLNLCKSENWVVHNTTKCPKCPETILIEGQEQFVRCQNCYAEFCQVCLDFQDLHGSSCGEIVARQCDHSKEFQQLSEANEKTFMKKISVPDNLDGQLITFGLDTTIDIRGQIAMTYAVDYFQNVSKEDKESLNQSRIPLCEALDQFDEYLSQLLGNVNEAMKNWREELINRATSLKSLSNSFLELY